MGRSPGKSMCARRVYRYTHRSYGAVHRSSKAAHVLVGPVVHSPHIMSGFCVRAGSTQAITGTVDGDAVVWDEQGVSAEVGTKATDRKAVKLMRVHSSAVSVLSTMGDFIVSGGADGFVRFFDPMLRLVAWFEHIDAGEITSISFSRAPMRLPDLDAQARPRFAIAPAIGTSAATLARTA